MRPDLAGERFGGKTHGHRHRPRRPRPLGTRERRRAAARRSRRPPSAACRSSRCTRPRASTASTPTPTSAIPASTRSRAASTPRMYRSRLWTMRQFAGFGTPRQTNERFKFLLDKGQTGLSTAFDLPTLMGLDSDDPRSLGEVGRLGVAVDTLDDMRELFDGIDLAKVSVSMTINAPADRRHGVLPGQRRRTAASTGSKLRGTIQNDILKEFHAQNEFVFPPEPSRAAGVRRDRVLHAARAAVEHGVDQRLPHPRGRLDRRAGAGLHAGRRLPLRRAVPGPRPGRRRLRPAAELLLQRPQRRLRGDRQVPRRPRAVGRGDAATATARRRRRRGSCASTPRRPAARCRTSSRR